MTDLIDDQVRALLNGTTPGPWTVEREGSFDRRTIYGVTEEATHFAVARAVEPRDAKLIAAAPDLAHALLQARADAAAAQAALIERAAGESAGEAAAHGASDLSPFLRRRVLALASDAGTAELARLRGELGMLTEFVKWACNAPTLSQVQQKAHKLLEEKGG